MSVPIHKIPRVKHAEDVEFIDYRLDKNGRAIWCWKCKICGNSYDNHRNISAHFDQYCGKKENTKKSYVTTIDQYFQMIHNKTIS